MSSDSAILDRSTEEVLRLDFELTGDEYQDLWRRISWSGRYWWAMPLGGVFIIAMVAFQAGVALGSQRGWNWAVTFNVFTGLLIGLNALTNNGLARLLGARLSRRWVSRTQLELDPTGIRGLIEFPSGWNPGPETKRINYTWRKVRKIHRLPEYVYLEFHGGGTVLIPETAFDTPDDVRQCVAWAEDGLAQQRPKMPVRNPAAA